MHIDMLYLLSCGGLLTQCTYLSTLSIVRLEAAGDVILLAMHRADRIEALVKGTIIIEGMLRQWNAVAWTSQPKQLHWLNTIHPDNHRLISSRSPAPSSPADIDNSSQP